MESENAKFRRKMTKASSASGENAGVEARMLPLLSGIVLEELKELTLVDVSRACAVHVDCIVELVREGVISPAGAEPHCWRFSGIHMRRATTALRLQRDLGVNLAGAALALQLLDEIETLRARLRILVGD